MTRGVKTTVRERIVRPAAGRIVGRGRRVGTVLLIGPLLAALAVALLGVQLPEIVTEAGALAVIGTATLGAYIRDATKRARCPACRSHVHAEQNYCGRCSTDVTTAPTRLERLADGTDDRRRLVERTQIDGELDRVRHGEDVLIAEHTDAGETVLHRIDPEVWESISESEPVEVYR